METNTLNTISTNLALVSKSLHSLVSESKGLNHSFATVQRSCDRHVTVNLRVDIYRVEDIDLPRQQFSCEFDLHVSWLDEERAKSLSKACDLEDFESGWHPEIFFPNAVKLNMVQKTFSTRSEDAMLCVTYRIHGTFKTDFNLRDFPFDYQMLRISVSSKWNRDVVLFRQDGAPKATSNENDMDLNTNEENTSPVRLSGPRGQALDQRTANPLETFAVLVSRKQWPVLLTFIPFPVLAGLLAVITLLFPPSEFTLVILIVLLVACLLFYRLVRRSLELPESRFTFVDEYMVSMVAVQFFSTLCGVVVAMINQKNSAAFITFGIMLFIFIVVHLVFLVRAIYKNLQRKMGLVRKKPSAVYMPGSSPIVHSVSNKYRIVSAELKTKKASSKLEGADKGAVESGAEPRYSQGGEVRFRSAREKQTEMKEQSSQQIQVEVEPATRHSPGWF